MTESGLFSYLRDFAGTDNILIHLAENGKPPGAMGAIALSLASAAAIAASMMFELDPRRTAMLALLHDALHAGDNDTRAYWNDQMRVTGQWKAATPTHVADVATEIYNATCHLKRLNHADMQVARLMSLVAKVGADVIKQQNTAKDIAIFVNNPAMIASDANGKNSCLDVVSAVGSWVTSEEGNDFLDVTSGLWNVNLGHGHAEPLAGFIRQAIEVAAINPFGARTRIQNQCAQQILDLMGMEGGKVFFCSSGSEAIELALRFGLSVLGSDAPIWAKVSSYHGSTMGAAGLCAFDSVWHPFAQRLKIGLAATIDDWRAPGLGFVEPICVARGGELLSQAELAAISLFQSQGGIVVADEIACGAGRTFWPSPASHVGLRPDVIVWGKGLANGVTPVACIILSPAMVNQLMNAGFVDFGHTHSNHAASIGAVEATLRALGTVDHHAFHTALHLALQATGARYTQGGSTGAILGSQPVDRRLAQSTMTDNGLLCHIPTMLDKVDRIVIAPPLTSSPEEMWQLGCRLVKVVQSLGWKI